MLVSGSQWSQLSYRQSELGPEVSEVDDQQGVVQPAAEDVVVVAVVVRVRAQLRVLRARHEHLREGVSEKKYDILMQIKGSFLHHSRKEAYFMDTLIWFFNSSVFSWTGEH